MANSHIEIWNNILNLDYNKEFLKSKIKENSINMHIFDLIERLLVLDPALRLGVENINDLKFHPYFLSKYHITFLDINWSNLKKQRSPSIKKYVNDKINELNKNINEKKGEIHEEIPDISITGDFTNIFIEKIDSLKQINNSLFKQKFKNQKINVRKQIDLWSDIISDT